MPLNYPNLDDRTRQFMVEEIESDAAQGKLYFSSYLSERGVQDWPELLLNAAKAGSDATFGEELRQNGRLNETAQRRKPKGGYTTVRVPITAHETLSEGEFNRFYIRGLCRRAITDGVQAVEVYRAKEVQVPRPESQAKIGMKIAPGDLLEDLRANVGVETSTGFPGPNSGLSVQLP
jgi:hypothetical protein